MRLARYFAKYYLGAIGLTWFALVVLVVSAMLIEKAGHLSKQPEGAIMALKLALLNALPFGYQMLPLACFFALIIVGTIMARRGEWLAAQAGGVQNFGRWGGLALVALCCSGGAYVAGETILPLALHKVEHIQRHELKRVDPLTRFYERRNHWYKDGEYYLFLPSFDRAKRQFYAPAIYKANGIKLTEVFEGRLLEETSEGWFLRDAVVWSMDSPEVKSVEALKLDLSVSAENLMDVTGDPRQMSYAQIQRLIDDREKAGFDTAIHILEREQRIAYPLAALALFFLILPWALHPGLRRSMAVDLGVGVVVLSVLLSLSHLLRMLALGQKIPVVLGGWGLTLVCLVFMPVSYFLYRRRYLI
jgi:LPS export ABC transporter permease LptG